MNSLYRVTPKNAMVLKFSGLAKKNPPEYRRVE